MGKFAYRIDEIAKMLDVSVKTIRREIADRNLDALQIRGSIRVPAEFLKAYLKRNHAAFLKKYGPVEDLGSEMDCDGHDYFT